MILIITHKTDFTADFVINKLNQKKINYRRFNCEDIFLSDYSLKFGGGFNVSLLGAEKFKSVWFRRTKYPEVSGLSGEEKLYIINETDTLFKNLFAIIDARWLSSPYAVYKAENKLFQLKIAQQIGFTIPQTLITNSKKQLKIFFEENNGSVIIKPLSQTRIQYQDSAAFIFTNTVPQKLIDEIDEYDLTPCIFQENIPKEYEIRVTVVENEVFSAKVYSQQNDETKIDWRRKKLKFVEEDLPKEIKELCKLLLKKMNLKFGAIDLIKTPNGKYVFLEINPNGQWAWVETQTGLNISDAIIAFLNK